MLLVLLLAQTAGAPSLPTSGGQVPPGGDGTLAFWAGLASIIGLVLTVIGLGLTVWSLRKAVEAQRGAEEARQSAEAVRDQYARKQRLPQFRDQLEVLATRLDTSLNDFGASQDAARETATQITRTLRSLTVHLHGDQLTEVNGLADDVTRHAGLSTLHHGQQVKNCTREVVLLLTHVIDDERAKSL